MAQPAPHRPVLREFPFADDEFRAIAQIAYRTAGLNLVDGKKSLVYARLVKRLRALGLADFRAYVALLTAPGGASEVECLIAALTTNVTAFFREAHHFQHFRAQVLPGLAARARGGGRVRLWSAACSSGEEPYSLAMCIFGDAPDLAQLDVRILATDIDGAVLDLARQGRYPASALRTVPGDLRGRHLARATGDDPVDLPDDIRKAVVFHRLNLMGEWPFSGPFDAIMCRNVAIYFDQPTQMRLWSRLQGMLGPGGYLYVGHSERVSGPAATALTNCGQTQYRNTATMPADAPGKQGRLHVT